MWFTLVLIGIAVAASGVLGVIQGRFGGVEFADYPVDAALGSGLGTFALMFAAVGFEGAAMTLGAVATGALCCYASTLGRGFGAERRDAQPPGPPATTG